MVTEMLLSEATQLQTDETMVEADRKVIKARSIQTEVECPHCGQASSRVHSRYQRTVADLLWTARPVCFELQVQRFFCDNATCPVKTFAEQFPTVVAPYGQRTRQMADRQEQTALALDDEAGARLTSKLAMTTSEDTLLQMIQAKLPQLVTSPRVLGVDGWVWRKGHHYDIILVDLEHHRVIDLLPERSAASLATWLAAHPGVEIICRDRGKDYIDCVTQEAPEAQQVADHWHLFQNLQEALKRILDQNAVSLYAAPVEPAPIPSEAASDAQSELAAASLPHETLIALHQQDLPLRAISGVQSAPYGRPGAT